MSEKRIDPDDGVAYTWDELKAYYKSKYKKKNGQGLRAYYEELEEYWENTCKPVKKKKGKGKDAEEPKAKDKEKGKEKEKAEKRIDPDDGEAYTWDELKACYKGKYKKKELEEYWENTCKPPKHVKKVKGKGKSEGKGKSKGPRVPIPKPDGCKSVVVMGLSFDATEEDLQEEFKDCGSGPTNVKLVRRDTGTSKGLAFVDFDDEKGVDEAMKHAGNELKGRAFFVDYEDTSRPREREPQPKANAKDVKKGKVKGEGKGKSKAPRVPFPKPDGCKSVVVMSLSFDATEEDLQEEFKDCGSGPTNVKLVMRRDTGTSKGLAFVDFDDETGVDEAMKHAGNDLKGRAFFVGYEDCSRPREEPPKDVKKGKKEE